jgi:predicted small integral membrane protein
MKEAKKKKPYRFPRKDTIRFCKIILLAATALFFTLVVIGGIVDYNPNFRFVSHVLSMDTTFPGNHLMGRAITAPAVHHLFYWIILIVETIIALLCWAAVFNCIRFFKTKEHFNMSLLTGIIALVLALLLWFTGFITIGGEWFAMWQSSAWNAEGDALRMFAINGITLLFLMARDD